MKVYDDPPSDLREEALINYINHLRGDIITLKMLLQAYKENSDQWQAVAELLDYDNQPEYHKWCERNPV